MARLNSICYWCHHGEPGAIAAIMDDAEERGFDLRWGPGHVVFEDENYGDHTIDECIAWCDDPKMCRADMTKDEIDYTREALRRAKEIPLAIREPEAERKWRELPEDYSGPCPCGKKDCVIQWATPPVPPVPAQ